MALITPTGSNSSPPIEGGNETLANRYKLEKCIGVGRLGVVYLASDSLLGLEKIAVKILHPRHLTEETLRQRFLREVQLTRKVNHPNVVKIFDAGSSGETLYLTMEYVPGVSLSEVSKNGLLPDDSIAPLAMQILAGLNAIHQAGITHRYLKPENIIVVPDGTVKITDFGLARPEQSALTANGEVLGSHAYMAPEIWAEQNLTPAIDLYGLGVILYELAAKTNPFLREGLLSTMRMHSQHVPPPPKELNPNTPIWLSDVIMRLLEKAPENRPASAGVLLEEFSRHLSGSKLKTVNGLPAVQLNSSDSFEKPNSEFDTPHIQASAVSGLQHSISSDAVKKSQKENSSPRRRSDTETLKSGSRSWRKKLTRYALQLTFATIAFAVLCRMNQGFRNTMIVSLLVSERNVGIEYSIIKKLVGTDLRFRTVDFLKAVREGDLYSVKLLLSAGMNPNIRDNRDIPALLFAATNHDSRMVELLLENHANLDAIDSKGRTALFVAVQENQTVVAEELLTRGLNVEAADDKGDTALIVAIRNKSIPMIKLLLKFNANPETKNNEGQSAHSLAGSFAEPAIKSLFVEQLGAASR